MAIKIGSNNTLSNDPSGDQEGQFRSVNFGSTNFPSSATEGDVAYDDGTIYVYNGYGWVDLKGNTSTILTGGTVSSPGDGFDYHVFTTDGTLEVSGGDYNVDVLLVAGGGGGGAGRLGGGGGAGGVLQTLNHPVTPGTYPVVVGSGGAGMPFWSTPNYIPPPTAVGAKGGNTTFDGLTANGGGTANNSYDNLPASSVKNGGSGAGSHPYSPYVGGDGTSGQGNPGGGVVCPPGGNPQSYFQSAGGGGAGFPGSSTNPWGYLYGVDGGDGRSYESYGFNLPTVYGELYPHNGEVYIAGGGGGMGGYPGSSWNPSLGGLGGGGGGDTDTGPTANPRQNGFTYGAGGGGGGFHTTDNYVGGSGYQGIAIIRKSRSIGIKQVATGGDHVYSSDGRKYHVFLQPGNFVINSPTKIVYGLVVGGGGGGGTGSMAGGGAGGGVREFTVNQPSGTYPIVVGDGGSGGGIAWGTDYTPNPPGGPGLSGAPAATNGDSSSALGYTAAGGGRGGSFAYLATDGGSGGGGSWNGPSPSTVNPGGTGNTPPVTPPQGNSGGSGRLSIGGGGGGLASSGGDGSNPNNPGDGGSGKDMTSVFPDQIPFRKFAGGGSGGYANPGPASNVAPLGVASYGGGFGGYGLFPNNNPVNPQTYPTWNGEKVHFQEMPPAFPITQPIGPSSAYPGPLTTSQNRFALTNGAPGKVNTGGGGGGGGGYSGPDTQTVRGAGGDGGSGIVILWYEENPDANQKATGGTIVTALGYKYHIFTQPGTFLTTEPITNAEYLVVAGGGGGGTGTGGGGGAGGVLNNTTTLDGSYAVAVGDGAAERTHPNAAENGSPSQLGPGIVSTGGGRGISGAPGGTVNSASPGGSGGGGGRYSTMIGSAGDGTPGQGNPGADTPTSFTGGAGGGGSAGGGGTTANGGAGKLYPGFPSAVIGPAIPAPSRSDFINAVSNGYYGGGGAGNRSSGAPGGVGGGGSISPSPSQSGNPGVDYTGGGGAGGWDYSPSTIGGGGGKGIVIIRYQ